MLLQHDGSPNALSCAEVIYEREVKQTLVTLFEPSRSQVTSAEERDGRQSQIVLYFVNALMNEVFFIKLDCFVTYNVE